MGVDVIVVVNGSDLGEEILRRVWSAAQILFSEYNIEVYVIPYYSPKSNKVSIIINGIEMVVTRKLNVSELVDMILNTMADEGKAIGPLIVGASFIDEGSHGAAAVIA